MLKCKKCNKSEIKRVFTMEDKINPLTLEPIEELGESTKYVCLVCNEELFKEE